MLTQREELARQLPENGWQLLSVEETSLEWWTDEIWLIESVWSPQGFRLYLTFLFDPLADSQRAKGQSVWAVGTSTARPVGRGSAEGKHLLTLGHGWRSRLAEFFGTLSELRNNASETVLPTGGES